MNALRLVPLCFIQAVSGGISHTAGRRLYYYCTKFIVSQYKCSHIVKTSELIDGTYGEKYKMAQSIFCVGFKPITATSFCCLSTDCLLIRHIS